MFSTAKSISSLNFDKNSPDNANTSSQVRPLPISIIFNSNIGITSISSESITLLAKNKNYNLKGFQEGQKITSDEIGEEFRNLCELGDQNLDPKEKSLVEKYKLAIMLSVEKRLAPNKTKAQEVKKPPKHGFLKRLLYIGLFILDIVPMAWGNYIGVVELLEFVPAISFGLGTAINLLTGAVEVILYYAMLSPLTKEALNLPDETFSLPKSKSVSLNDIYDHQLKAMQVIDEELLNIENNMKAAAYKSYQNLAQMFNLNLLKIKEYNIYYFNSKQSSIKTIEDLKNIPAKAIIIIDDEAYFSNNQQIIRTKSHEEAKIKLDLTTAEKYELAKAASKSGKVKLDDDNYNLIDSIRQRTLNKAKENNINVENQFAVKPYQESTSKKISRWLLTLTSIAINVAGSYAFALFLMGAAVFTAAMLSNPAGWVLLSVLVIGQVALQILLRNEGMFNLLNPGASKQEEVRKTLDEYEPSDKKYDAILKNKLNNEKLIELENTRQQDKNNDFSISIASTTRRKRSYSLSDLGQNHEPEVSSLAFNS
ncbi:MAG TPA: hypothetical protein VHA13_05905 [Gammaproteobacteria bacterium]|nr:hypothetical protein [Gammaproteobacteria bacterium]